MLQILGNNEKLPSSSNVDKKPNKKRINKSDYKELHCMEKSYKIKQLNNAYQLDSGVTPNYPFTDFYSQAGKTEDNNKEEIPIIKRRNSTSSIDVIEKELSYFTMDRKQKKTGLKNLMSLFGKGSENANDKSENTNQELKKEKPKPPEKNVSSRKIEESKFKNNMLASKKEVEKNKPKVVDEVVYAKTHIRKFNNIRDKFENTLHINDDHDTYTESPRKSNYYEDVETPPVTQSLLENDQRKILEKLRYKTGPTAIPQEKLRLPINRHTAYLKPISPKIGNSELSSSSSRRSSVPTKAHITPINEEHNSNVFSYDKDNILKLNKKFVEEKRTSQTQLKPENQQRGKNQIEPHFSGTYQRVLTPEEQTQQKRVMRKSVEEYYKKEVQKMREKEEQSYREYIDKMAMYGYLDNHVKRIQSMSPTFSRSQSVRYIRPPGSVVSSVMSPTYRVYDPNSRIYGNERSLRRVSFNEHDRQTQIRRPIYPPMDPIYQNVQLPNILDEDDVFYSKEDHRATNTPIIRENYNIQRQNLNRVVYPQYDGRFDNKLNYQVIVPQERGQYRQRIEYVRAPRTSNSVYSNYPPDTYMNNQFVRNSNLRASTGNMSRTSVHSLYQDNSLAKINYIPRERR